jgi:hypothetical protein
VGLITGLDDMEKRNILPLPGLELRLARSKSLYRLSCPDSRTLSIRLPLPFPGFAVPDPVVYGIACPAGGYSVLQGFTLCNMNTCFSFSLFQQFR